VGAFQIGAGDVVEKQDGRTVIASGQVGAPQRLLDRGLTGAQIVESVIEIVFVKDPEAEHFGDRVVAGPAHSGQPGALMRYASQDEKQGQFAGPPLAESRTEADLGGDVFEGVQDPEDWTGRGSRHHGVVELTAQQATEGVDAAPRPGGDIGQRPVLDRAVGAEGFPEQEGRWRGTIGDLGDIHAYLIPP
jgi:hypothetical protein